MDALIVTRGGEGSYIYTEDQRIEVPAASVRDVTDPTGCGDAYRGGLLYGLLNSMDWETTGRIAALMGAIKIQHHGTQNHGFDPDDFRRLLRESFGIEMG